MQLIISRQMVVTILGAKGEVLFCAKNKLFIMSKALHPKAAAFVSQIFFAELENRIAALPDKQSCGDAFEVFAEAYLATQRRHEAAHVWPLNAVLSAVLHQLNLGSKDYGIDRVFQTQLGQLNAYQVKFRTDRPALTWRELSTFMALADSPQTGSRILITNCDELASVLNDRQDFFCIRGSDFFNWGSEGGKRDFGGMKLTELWDVRYQELLEFKQQHGHCKVPYNFSDNPQLGKWVGNQRQKRKQNKLTPERERLLDEIGFLWSASPEPDEL